ncbi:unnamed protein product [Ectocarpus sp. 12 AP-2014]
MYRQEHEASPGPRKQRQPRCKIASRRRLEISLTVQKRSQGKGCEGFPATTSYALKTRQKRVYTGSDNPEERSALCFAIPALPPRQPPTPPTRERNNQNFFFRNAKVVISVG